VSFTANVDVSGSLEAGVDVAGVASLAGIADENAKLIPIWPPGVPVVFSYNPDKIKVTRRVQKDRDTGNTGTKPQRWKRTEPMEWTLDAWLEGPQTQPMADALLSLTLPGDAGLLGAILSMLGVPIAKKLPVAMFMWGAYVIPECNLTKCSIQYERFHATGIPLRAKCQIGLTEVPLMLPFTNPTSGGLPGREQHVVVAGESLPQLATRSYGQPAHWRDVAVANKIDDPFAIKPGDNLFMPAPGELKRRGGA
jgi:nucleoid-associated protein YgaU